MSWSAVNDGVSLYSTNVSSNSRNLSHKLFMDYLYGVISGSVELKSVNFFESICVFVKKIGKKIRQKTSLLLCVWLCLLWPARSNFCGCHIQSVELMVRVFVVPDHIFTLSNGKIPLNVEESWQDAFVAYISLCKWKRASVERTTIVFWHKSNIELHLYNYQDTLIHFIVGGSEINLSSEIL